MNNKVYVLMISWYDFEDVACNYAQVEDVYNNFYDAKKGAIDLVIDEFDVEMKIDNQYGNENPTLEDLINYLDRFNHIYLKQIYGYGKTCISIIEKEVK